MKTKIAVLGAGSWGTALAMLLARNGHEVILWGHNADHMNAMQQVGCNTVYLPDFPFPTNMTCSSDLAATVANADDVLIVVPSHAYNELLQRLKPLLKASTGVAWSSKGFCDSKCLHEVAQEYLGTRTTAVISGPSFAKEVAQGLPTAVVVASDDSDYAAKWAQYLSSDTFRPYQSSDVIGVEIAGAVKNILAIATGIAAGLQLGSNAQAALITRGLAEITRLGLAMGAQPETFMGLAGMGDLVLTCTDNQSRNRRFGFALGQGKSVADAKKSIAQVIEGIDATAEAHQLAKKYHVEMPIVEQVYNILYQHASVKTAVQALLARDLRAE